MKFPVMFTCVIGAGAIGSIFGLPGLFAGLIVGLVTGALVESVIVVHYIILDPDNRMLRIGGGKHEGKWFFRVDLWWIGVRFT